MKKILLLPVFIVLALANVSGQYYSNQNKFWAFGLNAGINFSSGSPVAVSTSISILEGCASVCDAGGSLLFYTDGKKVWDRTGAVMPSGSSIVPYSTFDAAQGAQIIPVIGNSNQYYIFSGDVYTTGRLSHSLVDMTLHGGLGDVVTDSSGILMGSNYAEKMTAVAGNSCNVWLITHRRDSAEFWVYNITAAGISSPVISAVGPAQHYNAGVMKVSPDRTKIVMQICEAAFGTHLFDFNPATGVVSNCQVLDPTGNNYGAEFSPDNTKVYSSQLHGSTIYQYDVSLPTTAAIIASKTIIGTSVQVGDLKLAPDNKIYIAKNTTALDVISSPDLAGTSCGFILSAFALASGTSAQLGLPNIEMPILPEDTSYMVNDTIACIPPGDSLIIVAHDTGTGSGYLWSDRTTTTRSHSITTNGDYWVQITNGCHLTIDTIKINGDFDTSFIHHDTSACMSGDYYFMTLTAPSGSDHRWYNGDSTSTNVISRSGTYWVRYINGCTITFDTFHVNLNINPNPISGPDTICTGDTTLLTDITTGGVWQSSIPGISVIGSRTGKITGITPGTSLITYTDSVGCYVMKNIIVPSHPCTNGIDQQLVVDRYLVEIFPNPVANELTVKTNEGAYNSFTITNSIGQVFLKEQIHSTQTQADVTLLPAGLYYIILNDNSGSIVRKLLKQ